MNYPIEYHYMIVTSQGNGLFRTKKEAMDAAEFQAQFSCGYVYQGSFDRYGAAYGMYYTIYHFLRPVEDDDLD